MARLMVAEDENWRFNYFPSISIGVEIGDVDNFADDVDELIDIIDDSSDIDDLSAVRDRFNNVLGDIGRSGYVKNSISVRAPVLPMYLKLDSIGASIFMDVSLDAQALVRVLDRPIVLDTQNDSLSTDTSVYLKSGVEKKFSFGYGREIYKKRFSDKSGGKSKLYGGIKLNVIAMDLSKQITRLEDLDGEEVGDYLRDQYDSNLKSDTNFGVDLGLLYDSEWYRLGLTLENLNSPSFDYGEIGVDCDALEGSQTEINSCYISQSFINDGRLVAREKHTKHALLRADALFKITSRWFLSGSVDLAKYDDIVGMENQWAHVSTSYEAGRFWIPSPRIGMQSNLAGAKLSSLTAGFTLFNVFSLDVEYGLSSVEVDDQSAPQRLGLSIAFEEKF